MSDEYPFASETVAAAFAAAVAIHGARTAVEDEQASLTYDELAASVAGIAHRVDAAAPAGVPIAILLPTTASAIAAILGIVVTGRPYLALDPGIPVARNRQIVEHTGAAAVIVDNTMAAVMDAIAPDLPRISIEGAAGPRIFEYRSSPLSAAYIYFTSGSTSRPKAVFQSQRNLVYEVRRHIAALDIAPEDRISLAFSPSVAGALRDIFGAVLSGACLSIVDLKRLGLQRAKQFIVARGITIWHSVPSVYRSLFGGDQDMGGTERTLRLVYLAGDRIVTSDVELFNRRFGGGCRLFLEIAATETNGFAHWFYDPRSGPAGGLIPVGYPRADKPVRLINDAGQPVTTGSTGEIEVHGHTLALGYWRDEGLTRERFRPSEVVAGGTAYRTGDLGRLRPDGLLEFIGRKDRRAKIRGNTVHLAEVEAVIVGVPNLAEIAVVARTVGADASLIAYCAPVPGRALTEESLRQRCRDLLPPPMRPAEFVILPELPKLPNGKLDLVGLAARDHGAAPASGGPAPVSASTANLPQIVRQAWEHYLVPESFEADAAFDAAGGDSLMGLELVVMLEQLLGRRVAAGTLDLETRPSDLIARLAHPSDEVAAGDDARPFLVLFAGMWGADVHAGGFARQLSDRFRVLVADFRLGGEDPVGPFDAERYFAALENEIRHSGPPARLWLVGYSYGAKLAAELGRRLLGCGIAVEAVVSLDGEAGAISRRRLNQALHHRSSAVAPRLRSAIERSGSAAAWLANALATRLVERTAHHPRLLHALLSSLSNLGFSDAHRLAVRSATRLIRVRAFGDLPSTPLPMALWLFVTDDPWHDPDRLDLGWEGRCASWHVIRTGGTHMSILNPPSSIELVNKLAALEISLRGPQSTATTDHNA